MKNTIQLIDQMTSLLQELSITYKPKVTSEGPIGKTLEVLTKTELSITQRSIVLYLIFNSNTESTAQREICDALGITMKCVRENLNALLLMGYVKRGFKYNTWDIK